MKSKRIFMTIFLCITALSILDAQRQTGSPKGTEIGTSGLAITIIPLECNFPIHGREPQKADVINYKIEFKKLADKYNIIIDWHTGSYRDEIPDGLMTARNANDWELEAYAPILISELSLYPVIFVQKAQLKRIIVCRDLWVDSRGRNENVSATLDNKNKTLYLCISYTYKVNNRYKQRRVIHHAFFHMLDDVMGLINKDSEWAKINPEGFNYGDYGLGGQYDRSSEAGLLTDKYPGFLNKYSTGYLADDKADIFAYMMVLYHYVEKRAKKDKVIEAKMQLMKKRLKQFCSDVNSNFWKKVEKIKRNITPYKTLLP